MAKKKASGKSAEKVPQFEEALAQLTDIVEELDSGDLSLEDSIKQFELGIALMNQCHATLSDAQKRVEVLVGFKESGEAVVEPYDDEASFDGSAGELF